MNTAYWTPTRASAPDDIGDSRGARHGDASHQASARARRHRAGMSHLTRAALRGWTDRIRRSVKEPP